MDNLKNLKALWEQQPSFVVQKNSDEIAALAKKRMQSIKSNHIWTISMLLVLIIALLYLLFTYKSDKNFDQIKGLELMIVVIICRVLLEIFSLIRFKKIGMTDSFIKYSKQLISYYKFRKWMHFIITPAIYLLYILGFVSLLPVFKQNFSQGFYLYILISGFGFLLIFSFVLYKVIKRDINNLDYLVKADSNS